MDVIFNGHRLNDYFYINNIQGLGIPNTRDIEAERSLQNGSVYSNTLVETRVITLGCTMLQDNKSIYTKLDELKNILNPFNGNKDLTFACFEGRKLVARYSGALDINQLTTMMVFPISFKCSNPFFESLLYSTVNFLPSTSTETFTVNSLGSIPTNKFKLIFAVDGNTDSNGVVITNNTTGKSLYLHAINTASNYNLILDFENWSITSSNLTNCNGYYSAGDFFQLVPGVNSISITKHGGLSNGNGVNRIEYKNLWL